MATRKKAVKKVSAAEDEAENLAAHAARARKTDALFTKLQAEWNKKHEGPLPVVRASETTSSYLLRRPTGITSLDVALAGGFAGGTISVIVGPDGVGKDFLFWTMAAEVQKIYKENFRMALYLTELRMDKHFVRDLCKFKIACTSQELDEINECRARIGAAPLTEEERAEYQTSVGEVYLIQGVTAEDALDQLTDFVRTNGCQLVGVNSLGFFETNAKAEKESLSDNPQQRSEAQVLTRFITRLSNIMNQMVMNSDTGELEANETSVVLVNQVRAKDQLPQVRGRPMVDKDKYRSASEAWALKHGKVIELFMHKGTKIYDEKNKVYLGKEVQWEITKGKLGLHEGARGSFQFFYDTGVDKELDLVETAKDLGVLEGDSWLTFKSGKYDLRLNGAKQFRNALLNDRALFRYLRKKCFAKAEIIYRHK